MAMIHLAIRLRIYMELSVLIAVLRLWKMLVGGIFYTVLLICTGTWMVQCCITTTLHLKGMIVIIALNTIPIHKIYIIYPYLCLARLVTFDVEILQEWYEPGNFCVPIFGMVSSGDPNSKVVGDLGLAPEVPTIHLINLLSYVPRWLTWKLAKVRLDLSPTSRCYWKFFRDLKMWKKFTNYQISPYVLV